MTVVTAIPHTVSLGAGAPEAVLTLPRRFDVHAVPSLWADLHQLGLEQGHRVALDASVVTHVDRAGLEFLAEAREQSETVGADITLTNVSLTLQIAMELTNLCGAPRRRHRDLLVELYPEAA